MFSINCQGKPIKSIKKIQILISMLVLYESVHFEIWILHSSYSRSWQVVPSVCIVLTAAAAAAPATQQQPS